jgi:monolysocardiolipin acyltransferase
VFYQQVRLNHGAHSSNLYVIRGLSTFFTLGQVLPTHRSAHSQFGGLFQPTVTQAIRLLSRGPFLHENRQPEKPTTSLRSPDLIDPFSSGHLTFSTNGQDTFPAPSAYLSRRHAWVHIFPEGMIHQTEDRIMRYFKWGVSRLILESEPMPDIVPIFIEGFDNIMHETRTFPRFIPRPFKDVRVTFGERLDAEAVFGDLRQRWKQIHAEAESKRGKLEAGVLSDELKYSEEAVRLRKECTRRVRQAVLDVRRQRGYPEDDPKNSLAETWLREGHNREGRKEDGSITKDI